MDLGYNIVSTVLGHLFWLVSPTAASVCVAGGGSAAQSARGDGVARAQMAQRHHPVRARTQRDRCGSALCFIAFPVSYDLCSKKFAPVLNSDQHFSVRFANFCLSRITKMHIFANRLHWSHINCTGG